MANSAMAYVSGENDFLTQSQGRAFIPQKPSTSGMLGESIGNFVVGGSADTITLSQGQVSQGSLTYDLFFDLTEDLQPGGEPVAIDPALVDTSSANLLLDLTDIDFVPVSGGGRTYSESLTLTVYDVNKTTKLSSSGDGTANVGTDYVSVPVTVLTTTGDLLIDALNYGYYREDGFGATNNTTARYTINLADDLGLTTAAFGQIFEQMGFILQVTITSTTMRTAPGVGTYRNTAEYLGDYSSNNDGFGDDGVPPNGLEFEIIPEPMTLTLLGLGSLGLLRRRR